MGKVKDILSSIERNKGKIMRIFIFCSILKFYISAIYRIYEDNDSRKQLETNVNIYALFVLGIVFFHEFLNCLVPKFIIENFKMITHFSGKGIIFIFISIIFMNPLLGNQQNYSGYMLLCVGILSIIADFKLDLSKKDFHNLLTTEKQTERIIDLYAENDTKNVQITNSDNFVHEVKVKNTESAKPKLADNPYDIPDDF